MSRTLTLIRDELELEGYAPGTPEYEKIFLVRQVARCQEMQGVGECPSCKAFLDCSLAKRFMMQTRFGG